MSQFYDNTVIEEITLPPTSADLLDALLQIQTGADAQEPLVQDLRKVIEYMIIYGGAGGGVPPGRLVGTTNSLQGGGDLQADRILSLVGDVPSPPATAYYGTNAAGLRGWFALPNMALYVPSARQITGILSLAGGGDLSADRSIYLLNDSSTPAPMSYYGTDITGTKGWFVLPVPPPSVPASRQVATINSLQGGGDLSTDRTLQLVGDMPVVPAFHYYGTGSDNALGWRQVPQVPDLTTRQLTGVQSVAGGGDLSADRTFYLVNDQTNPPANSFYGTDLSGLRGWFAMPNTANLVSTSRNINTAGSLTGGGNLSADRTLQLVGDLVNVPNLFYYGTDSGGILGWHDLGAMFATTLTGVMSIAGGGSIGVSSTFKLVNDQATPPGSCYYGTNSAGLRGWYALPAGGGGVSPALQINTIDSLTGGGDLSANRTLSLVGDQATPSASSYYGTDAGGVRGFFALPSGGGGVSPTVQVNTSGSLTGGGDLSANRTHTLVGDNATPGNSMYYGTDASGTKGFFALPNLAGYVPTSRRINTVNSLAGGATLGADITIQLQGDQVTPPASNYYGTDVNGNRGFFPLTGGVPPTRTIATQMSLTGGGDLTANRTLTLVGDVASPAVSNYYGTNAAGVRGWYAISALAGKNAFTTSAVVFTVPPVGQTVDVTLTDASWVAVGQMVAVQTAGGAPTAAGSLQCTNKNGNVVTLLNAPAASAVDEIGTIKGWAGTVKIPMTWLSCDGSAVSRTTYPDLFALIGTSYGAGDGSTTFALPDFRGRAVLGAGQGTGLTARAIGDSGGEETHRLTIAELAAHTHIQNAHNHVVNSVNNAGATFTAGATVTLFASTAGTPYNPGTTSVAAVNQNAGGDGAHNNMQPYGVALWIIKVSGGGGATAQAPIADSTQNGLLRKVSGLNTDYVDGTNNSRPLGPVIVGAPAGTPAPPGAILIPSLAQSPDGIWTPQTAFDDHFEGSVLDPKWTRSTTAGTLYPFEEVAGSWYTLGSSGASAAGPYDSLMTQPLPNANPFELIMRLRHRSCPSTNTAANTSFSTLRFYLWNGTSGIDVRMGASFAQTGSTYLAALWIYYGTAFGSVTSLGLSGMFEYIKLKYNTGGSVNVLVSSNGTSFYEFIGTAFTGAQTGFATTPPNSVGIGHRNIWASRSVTQIDWVRFVNT